MSLFGSPAEHATNDPTTWNVQRSGRRWQLRAAGVVLNTFERKADAEAARTEGPLARLYAKETRWYAGENVEGWKPYVPAPTADPAAAYTGAPVIVAHVTRIDLTEPADDDAPPFVSGWSQLALPV